MANKKLYFIYTLPSIFSYIFNVSKILFIKKKFAIKTICIGNVFVGGTGKTSLAIEINELLRKKFKTVFVKKKYKNFHDLNMYYINYYTNKIKLILKLLHIFFYTYYI